MSGDDNDDFSISCDKVDFSFSDDDFSISCDNDDDDFSISCYNDDDFSISCDDDFSISCDDGDITADGSFDDTGDEVAVVKSDFFNQGTMIVETDNINDLMTESAGHRTLNRCLNDATRIYLKATLSPEDEKKLTKELWPTVNFWFQHHPAILERYKPDVTTLILAMNKKFGMCQ